MFIHNSLRRAAIIRQSACVGLVVAAGLIGIGAQQSPDRSKPPASGPAPTLKIPAIQKRALSNGLPVWIVGMHEVPVIDVTLIVKSGTTADPVGRYGLANLTAAMLDEGAGSRSALDLADAVEFLGASLSTASSFDFSSVHLHSLVSKFDAALPLFADVALRPTFPPAELERLRKERLTTLLQTRDDPASLASMAFSRLLFGPSHRFGTPTMGNEASNRAFSAADVRGFYDSHYQPQNATLLVVGDVTPAAALPKLERAFGGWKNGAPIVKPAVAAAAQPAARQLYLIDKPGAAQSQIRMGLVGVARSTPDYFIIDVMNTMLGGSFSSRLQQNLREEHGYTYGASSSFSMRAIPGPFVAGAGVQSDKTVESLREFFKEIDGMKAPVPAAELNRVRNLQALGFPANFETTSNMAERLTELVVYGLPETFLAEYVPKIQAVAAADLQRAAGQYLPSEKFAVVVVGDLAKIEQPIRSANFGPVRVVTIDEILR
jgi:zinc protease